MRRLLSPLFIASLTWASATSPLGGCDAAEGAAERAEHDLSDDARVDDVEGTPMAREEGVAEGAVAAAAAAVMERAAVAEFPVGLDWWRRDGQESTPGDASGL